MAQKKKDTVRRPGGFGLASLLFLLFVAAGGYLAFCFGPPYLRLFMVRQHTKEAASAYYRLSSLEKTTREKEATKLMDETRRKIVEVLGAEEPTLQVQLLINEESKKVNVVAEYDHTVRFVGTQRSHLLHLTALGESDYTPNEW